MRRASGLAFTCSPSARTGWASAQARVRLGAARRRSPRLSRQPRPARSAGALGRCRGARAPPFRPAHPRAARTRPRPGADDPDGRADVDLAVRDDDLQEDAVGLRLDLLRHLVGVELVERLALRDRVALGLQPADDRPGLHALAQPRELDLGRHR
jgi:hypothetical protein